MEFYLGFFIGMVFASALHFFYFYEKPCKEPPLSNRLMTVEEPPAIIIGAKEARGLAESNEYKKREQAIDLCKRICRDIELVAKDGESSMPLHCWDRQHRFKEALEEFKAMGYRVEAIEHGYEIHW